MFHIRMPNSTPNNMQTYCGQQPERTPIVCGDEYKQWQARILDCEVDDLAYSESVAITDWEWVKSMPNMRSLCPKCVELAGGVNIVVNYEEAKPMLSKEEIEQYAEEDDFIPF